MFTISIVGPGRKARVLIWNIVVPGRRLTLPSKAGDSTRRVTLSAGPTLFFFCNTSLHFVKK